MRSDATTVDEYLPSPETAGRRTAVRDSSRNLPDGYGETEWGGHLGRAAAGVSDPTASRSSYISLACQHLAYLMGLNAVPAVVRGHAERGGWTWCSRACGSVRVPPSHRRVRVPGVFVAQVRAG